MKQFITASICLLIICTCLAVPVMADESGMEAGQFTFSGEDFYTLENIDGIFLCQVPDPEDGVLCLGDRVLRAGDFLTADTLAKLELRAVRDATYSMEVRYQPITDRKLGETAVFTMHVQSSKNEPPVCQSIQLETYKNIPNTASLQGTDPEGQPLTYEVEQAPKRGDVEIRADGTFLYSPTKNKVGEDEFTYYATDPAGNRSESALVKIRILDSVDRSTFSDLSSDSQFLPMWSRNSGLFGGENVAGEACFGPDRPVTRGEFLATAMKLAGITPEIGLRSSGFADQEDAPLWVQSYLVSAMRRGLVSGVGSDEGLLFYPNREITAVEAAIITERVFNLQQTESVSAVGTNNLSWRELALNTAVEYHLTLPAGDTFTRLDAAALLYSAQAGK